MITLGFYQAAKTWFKKSNQAEYVRKTEVDWLAKKFKPSHTLLVHIVFFFAFEGTLIATKEKRELEAVVSLGHISYKFCLS